MCWLCSQVSDDDGGSRLLNIAAVVLFVFLIRGLALYVSKFTLSSRILPVAIGLKYLLISNSFVIVTKHREIDFLCELLKVVHQSNFPMDLGKIFFCYICQITYTVLVVHQMLFTLQNILKLFLLSMKTEAHQLTKILYKWY